MTEVDELKNIEKEAREEIARKMASPSSIFVLGVPQEAGTESVDSYLRFTLRNDTNLERLKARYYEAALQSFSQAMEDNWVAYDLFIGEGQSTIAVSPDGKLMTGPLAAFSRYFLDGSIETPKEATNSLPSAEFVKGCSDTVVLTKNIFGNPAERASICQETKCYAGKPACCQVYDALYKTGFLATLKITPITPFDGKVSKPFCSSHSSYEIVLFNGLGAGDIALTRGLMSIRGSIAADQACNGDLKAVRIKIN